MANPSPAPRCVTRQAPQLHPHLCRVGPVSALCAGGISVYFTDGETEAGESRGVGAVLSHPSIQLGLPWGDRRLSGYPPHRPDPELLGSRSRAACCGGGEGTHPARGPPWSPAARRSRRRPAPSPARPLGPQTASSQSSPGTGGAVGRSGGQDQARELAPREPC